MIASAHSRLGEDRVEYKAVYQRSCQLACTLAFSETLRLPLEVFREERVGWLLRYDDHCGSLCVQIMFVS